jgi:hypothetical protein
MAIICQKCGFEFDESEDIYCSGCGDRIASVSLATADVLTFYAEGRAVSPGAAVKVQLTNQSLFTRFVRVRSLDRHTRTRFHDDMEECQVPAGGQVSVVVTAEPTLRAGTEERIEFYCRSGRLAEITRVRVSKAPTLLVRIDGSVTGSREGLLDTEVNTFELRAPSLDDEERVTRRSPTLSVAPAEAGSLSLEGPVLIEPASAANWLVLGRSPTTISKADALIFSIDSRGLAAFDADQEATVSLPFVSLGKRTFKLKAGVQRQPRIEATAEQLFLHADGLLRNSNRVVRQCWRIVNRNAASVVIERITVSGTAADGVTVFDAVVRGVTLTPGANLTFEVEYYPQRMFNAMALQSQPAATQEFLRAQLVFTFLLRWAQDGAATEAIRKDHEVDLRVPQVATLLALDFGTSNTCIAYVKDLNAAAAVLNAVQPDKARLLQELSRLIEFAELDDPNSSAGNRRELASVVRVDKHSKHHDDPSLESTVGWTVYNEMFLASYARRTAWMLKRGLSVNGFGPSLMDLDANARTYRWSTLVENYLTHTFRRLIETRNVIPAEVVYSYPGTWDSSPAIKKLLHDAIQGALRAVGAESALVSAGLNEPEALAIHYANALAAANKLPEGDTAVDLIIFDCGGGTTDVTCMRLNGRVMTTATGKTTTWSTDASRRLTNAKARGGEDLTFDVARAIHTAFKDTVLQQASTRPANNIGSSLKDAVLGKKANMVGEPSLLSDVRIPSFPPDVGRYTTGNAYDSDERAVLDGIMVNARNWKLGKIEASGQIVKFPVKASTIQGAPQTVNVEVRVDILDQVVRVFFEQLFADLLIPTVDAYAERGRRADHCFIVPCGNSTRHRIFTEVIAHVPQRIKKWNEYRSVAKVMQGDDDRKSSVVHGLLIQALRECDPVGGLVNPLVNILDYLPVESGRMHAVNSPNQQVAIHVQLIAGLEGVVCQLERGRGFPELLTQPTRAKAATGALLVAASADGPWITVWESSRTQAGSDLARAFDAAGVELRRICLCANVEDVELVIAWKADAVYGTDLPGGVLARFQLDEMFKQVWGAA